MALIQETGAGLPNSNTYASVADLRSYAALRGVTVPTDDADCEVLLIKAMDRMEAERDNYQGDRVFRTQALSMPRFNMYVDNWYVLSTEIPRNAIYAQCAFAIEAQNLDLLPTVEGNAPGPITQETVGPITTVYANPGHVRRTPAVTKAETLLKTLLKRNGLFAVRA
jgi:hypothetical protein